METLTETIQTPSEAPTATPRRFISIVTPAFNEVNNLPLLYERLKAVLVEIPCDWEWVIVDDHSADATFAVINRLAAGDNRIRGLRLARNSGAHIALTCALHAARGECAIALASDLQDPPETIPRLLEEWQAGHHVVWAARSQRLGESAQRLRMSRIYYWLMRHVVGLKEIPPMGADFFLLDREVLAAFRQFREGNVSILALITWMGFRQTFISYTKQARASGESGWTLKKKLKLLVDSVTGFSYVPIRFMSYLGIGIAFLGFIYAIVVIFNALFGSPTQGWSALMVVLLVIGGVQMMMLGILGEYLWRALDETRRRPLYLVEDTTDFNNL
ncbi:MAG: glycosyltransferase family 2 protein [Candidatus Competibacter sp.]|nr:glycosyltransferase family 2 protein [Candidatus Competibacter sp.]